MTEAGKYDRRLFVLAVISVLIGLLGAAMAWMQWQYPQQSSSPQPVQASRPHSQTPSVSSTPSSPDSSPHPTPTINNAESQPLPTGIGSIPPPSDDSFLAFAASFNQRVLAWGSSWTWWQLFLWWLIIPGLLSILFIAQHRMEPFGFEVVVLGGGGLYSILALPYMWIFWRALTNFGLWMLWIPAIILLLFQLGAIVTAFWAIFEFLGYDRNRR